MMTSLNEEILDQWSAEQNKTKLADQVLVKWNKVKKRYNDLLSEHRIAKKELEEILEENNSMRVKFTTLLETFQKEIIKQDKLRQGLI